MVQRYLIRSPGMLIAHVLIKPGREVALFRPTDGADEHSDSSKRHGLVSRDLEVQTVARKERDPNLGT